MPEHSTRRIKYTTLHITATVEGESRNMYFRDVCSDGLFVFRDVAVVARSLINRTDAYIRKLLSGHLTGVYTARSFHYFRVEHVSGSRASSLPKMARCNITLLPSYRNRLRTYQCLMHVIS